MNKIVCFVVFMCSYTYAMEVNDLRCESQTNPTGITSNKPHFSWTFIGDAKSPKQGGYRIVMATSPEKLKYPDLWDSGPTSSSQSSGIEYSGAPLKDGQRVYWKCNIKMGVLHII